MNNFVDSLTDWSVTSAQLWNLAAREISGYANKQTRSVTDLKIHSDFVVCSSIWTVNKNHQNKPSPSIGLWYHSLSFIKGSRCDFLWNCLKETPWLIASVIFTNKWFHVTIFMLDELKSRYKVYKDMYFQFVNTHSYPWTLAKPDRPGWVTSIVNKIWN